MNLWNAITGTDMTKEFKSFELRVKKLPKDYQLAWKEVKINLWQYSDFSGRNLIPIFEGVLCFLEESSIEGQGIDVIFGGNIKGFCTELVSEEGGKSFRDRWRQQLNKNISKKLEE